MSVTPETFGIRGCYILRRFLRPDEIARLIDYAALIIAQAPLARPHMPQGTPFKLTLTNAGKLGWWSDGKGYRYTDRHPDTGKPWPEIPPGVIGLCYRIIQACGVSPFTPDNLLINHYAPGESLGPHQDKTERDQSFPIVSLSVGADAAFAIGPGEKSARRPETVLCSGDVVVMDGPARRAFHEVKRIMPTMPNPVYGGGRFNFTLRRAG